MEDESTGLFVGDEKRGRSQSDDDYCYSSRAVLSAGAQVR